MCLNDFLKEGNINILTGEILMMFINKIEIHEEYEITIHFSFQDPFAVFLGSEVAHK